MNDRAAGLCPLCERPLKWWADGPSCSPCVIEGRGAELAQALRGETKQVDRDDLEAALIEVDGGSRPATIPADCADGAVPSLGRIQDLGAGVEVSGDVLRDGVGDSISMPHSDIMPHEHWRIIGGGDV